MLLGLAMVTTPTAPSSRRSAPRSPADWRCAARAPGIDSGAPVRMTTTFPRTSSPAKSSTFASGLRRPWPTNTRGASTSAAGSTRSEMIASGPSSIGVAFPSRTRASAEWASSIVLDRNRTGWMYPSVPAGWSPSRANWSATNSAACRCPALPVSRPSSLSSARYDTTDHHRLPPADPTSSAARPASPRAAELVTRAASATVTLRLFIVVVSRKSRRSRPGGEVAHQMNRSPGGLQLVACQSRDAPGRTTVGPAVSPRRGTPRPRRSPSSSPRSRPGSPPLGRVTVILRRSPDDQPAPERPGRRAEPAPLGG